MSASGFTPNRSEASRNSSSPATSSSHQPAAKQLRAMEAADEDSPPKQISDSTDEDLEVKPHVLAFPVDAADVALPVPAVPDDLGEGEADEDVRHDADDFVPNSQRAKTLQSDAFNLHVIPEVFELGGDDDHAKDEKDEPANDLHSLTDDKKSAPEDDKPKLKEESLSRTPASDSAGTQPAAGSSNSPFESSVHVVNSVRARSLPPAKSSQSDVFGLCTTFKQAKNVKPNKN